MSRLRSYMASSVLKKPPSIVPVQNDGLAKHKTGIVRLLLKALHLPRRLSPNGDERSRKLFSAAAGLVVPMMRLTGSTGDKSVVRD